MISKFKIPESKKLSIELLTKIESKFIDDGVIIIENVINLEILNKIYFPKLVVDFPSLKMGIRESLWRIKLLSTASVCIRV